MPATSQRWNGSWSSIPNWSANGSTRPSPGCAKSSAAARLTLVLSQSTRVGPKNVWWADSTRIKANSTPRISV